MTNREWLLKEMQNMSDEELAEMIDKDWNFYCIKTKRCIVDCTKCKLWWLKQEHEEKIKSPDIERNILTYLPKEYKYIARDSDCELYVYKEKPEKKERCWHSNDFEESSVEIFNHLFQFVKWEDEEPYNIEELLKSSEDED